MKMPRSDGYTIVEVMVVLAISGLLFTSVLVTLAGRQNSTEFMTAIRDTKAQIQQTISEVSSGYYPSQENFSCTAVAGAPSITTGSSKLGTNADCIFIGKVIQFGISGTSPEQMITYPAVGVRQSGGSEVTSLADARPAVLSPSTARPNVPDNTDNRPLKGGLTTLWVKYGAAGTNIGAVGFVSSLAQYQGGSLSSGSQQVNLVPIVNSVLGSTQSQGAQSINDNLASSPLDPAEGVRICMVSGATAQSGILTIGSNGRQLSVTMTIKENKTCS